jgi:ADP-ribose pyrophosphatase
METKEPNDELLHEGKHLSLRRAGRWEYAVRNKASGVVAVLAITPDSKVLLVEQFRPPLQRHVIEIPAGLAGDVRGAEAEAFIEAARRELFEETGYSAESFEFLCDGPASAGLTTEIITFYRALNLQKTGAGGGDGSENIHVHEVAVDRLDDWLAMRRADGCLVDYKVYAALYFHLRKARP